MTDNYFKLMIFDRGSSRVQRTEFAFFTSADDISRARAAVAMARAAAAADSRGQMSRLTVWRARYGSRRPQIMGLTQMRRLRAEERTLARIDQ